MAAPWLHQARSMTVGPASPPSAHRAPWPRPPPCCPPASPLHTDEKESWRLLVADHTLPRQGDRTWQADAVIALHEEERQYVHLCRRRRRHSAIHVDELYTFVKGDLLLWRLRPLFTELGSDSLAAVELHWFRPCRQQHPNRRRTGGHHNSGSRHRDVLLDRPRLRPRLGNASAVYGFLPSARPRMRLFKWRGPPPLIPVQTCGVGKTLPKPNSYRKSRLSRRFAMGGYSATHVSCP